MKMDSILEYAGDLSKELEEMDKLIPNEEQVENVDTYTLMCGSVFTIKCC